MSAEDTIGAAAARLTASGDSRPRAARDPVNLPMIRNWTEVIDPGGPCDAETAPPAMIQVWTMPGLHGARAGDDPLGQMSQVLDEAGYTSVVATNCDQAYHRYLKTGEQLSVQARLLDVTGPKRTALGEGWFVTTRSTWFSAGEPVATMDFRILKFCPPDPAAATPPTAREDPTSPMLPLITPDTAFFWDGRAKSLEEQALQPVEDPNEMGAKLPEVIVRLIADKDYAMLFAKAFPGEAVSADTLAKAIASFERVLLRGDEASVQTFQIFEQATGKRLLFDSRHTW